MTPKEHLIKLHARIVEAANKGRGCRVTSIECRLLMAHNLPSTCESVEVME